MDIYISPEDYFEIAQLFQSDTLEAPQETPKEAPLEAPQETPLETSIDEPPKKKRIIDSDHKEKGRLLRNQRELNRSRIISKLINNDLASVVNETLIRDNFLQAIEKHNHLFILNNIHLIQSWDNKHRFNYVLKLVQQYLKLTYKNSHSNSTLDSDSDSIKLPTSKIQIISCAGQILEKELTLNKKLKMINIK